MKITDGRFQRSLRGVALIEAMIAMLVMAFGTLALVGVQATLRLNSDIAKQRAEATRIGLADLERARNFISVAIGGTLGILGRDHELGRGRGRSNRWRGQHEILFEPHSHRTGQQPESEKYPCGSRVDRPCGAGADGDL